MVEITFFIIGFLTVLLSKSRLRELISVVFLELDVGVNARDWVAVFMRLVGLDIKYYVLEPTPSQLATLRLRFLNLNASVLPHAVDQEPGLEKFRQDGVFSSVDPVNFMIDVRTVNPSLALIQIELRSAQRAGGNSYSVISSIVSWLQGIWHVGCRRPGLNRVRHPFARLGLCAHGVAG